MKQQTKKLVLENGMEFIGTGFGAATQSACEIIFHTAVEGYQEIISDPSYANQIVVMTYPIIGNYGITDDDFEGRTPLISGLVVRELCDTPSNFRYTKTVDEELEEHGIPCISGIDTRMMTGIIRDKGRMMAAIVNGDTPTAEALEMIARAPKTNDMVSRVSTRKRWFSRTPDQKYQVVIVDCGIKTSVIRKLNSLGCNITIVPYNASAEHILSFNPDGILFSNGPGNPYDVPVVRELFERLKGTLPIFGIGLGFEIIGLSYGAQLEEMFCGIHGDHPVRELPSGRINIGVLNQSFRFKGVENTSLTVTHESVPEKMVLGFENKKDRVFAVQFQPEGAPGPKDNIGLFDKFIKLREE